MKTTRVNPIISAAVFLLTTLIVSSCSTRPEVIWTEGEKDLESGAAIHTLKVINAPEGTDWKIWLTSNLIRAEVAEGTQGEITLFHGCLYQMTPYEHTGKDLVVTYKDIPLQRHCWAPEGFVLEHKGEYTPLKVTYEFLPSEDIPDFPYNQTETNVWDMIPSLKSVVPSEGKTIVEVIPDAAIVAEAPEIGWYRITLDGTCTIEAADEDGAFYAKVTLENMIRNAGSNVLPNLVIEDWPDFSYRGFMLDISRNFTTKKNILKLIDLLAHYKASVFHLHFGDDEGWRMEVPQFPELTTFGAHHAMPEKMSDGTYEEVDCLMPSYNGSIDPKDMTSTANGYLTVEDYIEVVKYAWERRIKVIPEFDTPGHSRAAIKAMEAYAKRTGDDTVILHDPEDTSRYCSVQYYRDNAINVAMPSTYKFIEIVFDHIIACHEAAGAPLDAIHIGGDEVPLSARIF